MRKTILILLVIAGCMLNSHGSSAQMGYWGQIKTNIYGDLGADVGVSFSDRFAFRLGLMTDLDRMEVGNGKNIDAYKKVSGNNYRLSYSAGPMMRLVDWLWISATAGYGETGTYAYDSLQNLYGISGKISGFETGLQLQLRFGTVSLEVGYGTIIKSFSLGRPYHDISFGIGIYL